MKKQTRIGLAVGLTLALLAGLAPRAEAVSASGGNYTNDIPGYRIHVFTNSATASNFVVSAASPGDTVEVLVVAGGGGGGNTIAGGGGAGGLVYNAAYPVTAQDYVVVVGGGGAGGPATRQEGGNGTNSTVTPAVSGTTITAVGGGGGGGLSDAAGRAGGSGGGAAANSASVGTSTQGNTGGTGYGSSGGSGTAGSNNSGGGGGGAGGAGGGGTASAAGAGGIGRAYSTSGSVVYYAGGGGGGGRTSVPTTGGVGGLGGGGDGKNNAIGANGAANTGGGGGAGGFTGSDFAGGAGGSGIVVVRYAVPNAWTYSMPITFTNDARLNTLTNFPALVIFDTNKVNYSQFLANGQDLRFMDSNGAELRYEVETWMEPGGASNSYIWVQIPTMTAGCVITAYWGNASAVMPSYRTNGTVWDANFKGVWHLAEASGTRYDTTANQNTATPNGTVTKETGTASQGDRFSYADGYDYDEVANSTSMQSIQADTFTIEAWFRPANIPPATRGDYSDYTYAIVAKQGYHSGLFYNSAGKFFCNIVTSDNVQRSVSADSASSTGVLHHVVQVVNRSAGWERLYVDGQQAAADLTTVPVNYTVYNYGTLPWRFGTAKTSAPQSYSYGANGAVDEVRLSNLARGSNWVWATYQTMAINSAFSTYGTVSGGDTTSPQIQNQTPTGVTTLGATFNGYLVTNGASAATVYVAWGQTNGSVSGSWASTNWWNVGAWTNGSYPSTNMALSANANYYYTFGATNSLTNVVASGYQYLITGEVTVQPTDPTGRVSLADTAAFTVYRPASCTNEAITVAYTLGGTATSGTHYTNSPAASGTSGTVTIPAGQTNAVVTVWPLNVVAPQQTVVLTLASNNYAIGAANAATCTLAAASLTLGTNAYINGSSNLVSDSGGTVLLTATSGTGTQADPYIFDLPANLNMGSYTIRGSTNNSISQYSATWRVAGNVTGTGNFDSYTTANNTYGGNVRIEAGGTIAVNRIDTRGNNGQNGGSVYLWATGVVTIATYIDTRTGGGAAAGAVTIRSEGPVAGQGITISGSVNGDDGTGYSVLTEAKIGGFAATSAGAVSLYCRTNITLAAGISTRYGTAGAVLIRGDVTDAAVRAGTVSIGGTGGIRTDSGGRGGNVTNRATAFQLTGGINTSAAVYQNRTGNVDIDVLENATIGGVIDTRMLYRDFPQGSPGYVKIVARRIALLGVDAGGYSVRTWPGTLYAGRDNTHSSVAGDADVTLTGIDTSGEIYDPANPTNSMTSSIYVAGKINTGRWYSNDAMGNIRISAVEVQLVGDLTNSSSTASSIMSIHYGTNAYGVVTHLLENGVRWNGVASHIITYYMASGTKTFVGDVPYAGKLSTAVAGTIENGAVTNVTQTSATFRGHLQTAGDPASAVSVVWGQTAGNLDSTNGWTAGTWGDNSYPSTNISPLTANTNYYYTFVAANAGGTNAAGNTQYLITGPLTVLTGDGLCGVSATDTASIAISRPGTCVSGPLTVNYALSGAGTGYVSASPASGFTLAAGQASTNITIQPVAANSGAPASVTLTLLPGAYPSDVLGSDSISVGTMVASDVTLTGDVYIDAADGGKLKYVSGGAVAAYAWNGTTLDGETYDYTYQFNNLNLGGYNIHGALNHNQSQSRALFQVSGNVSGGGSFQFHTTAGNLIAGNLRLEAAGSIALSNVWTYVTPNGTAASTYLWAKGGPVTLTGSINNEGASTRVAPVVVRSEGPAGSRGIAVAGGNSGFSIRTHNGGSSSGGKPVWLCTEGDITLGGDVVATANGGGVTIRGNYTNAALRAGNVVVRGSIPTWVMGGSINITYGSGNISVLATNLVVDGNLLTYCQSYNQRGGGIRVDVTGDARIGGYLDTHTEATTYDISSPGSVYILARRTAINGTNTTGHSILTKPTNPLSKGFVGSQSGDGNITLTNVDTSTSQYNPETPLQSDTSSLCVSGKVEAAYCSANIQGDIYLSAVEVQLAGEIATSTGPNSDIAVHYGVTTYGIVTHLVENGTRWNGSDGHNVTYGLATPAFFADVPYLGTVNRGTVFKFR